MDRGASNRRGTSIYAYPNELPYMKWITAVASVYMICSIYSESCVS